MLLSRVAENLYWGARYLERAEDTARIVRNYTDLLIDLPTSVSSSWEPLLAIAGNRPVFDEHHARADEADVVRFLVASASNSGSVTSSIAGARENLRTTREVLPREAWLAVNDLFLYTGANGETGVERRSRSRFLNRVIADCQQLEGIMSSSMSRDAAYLMWTLGQAVERADMTTRVIGVRAASLLAEQERSLAGSSEIYDEVQWMGLLRSLSALQMYQRATRGPIEGSAAVGFLLFDPSFPRSVASCVAQIRESLQRLPNTGRTLPPVDQLEVVLSGLPTRADDGAALDAAMDEVQIALMGVHSGITEAFVRAED